jgi:hypothetical protein
MDDWMRSGSSSAGRLCCRFLVEWSRWLYSFTHADYLSGVVEAVWALGCGVDPVPRGGCVVVSLCGE